MPSSRTRLLALTGALALTLSLTGVTHAGAAATDPTVAGAHAGLDRLLASGTPDGRAIVRFDAVPGAAQVDALERSASPCSRCSTCRWPWCRARWPR